MTNPILSDKTLSVSEFKKNPSAAIRGVEGAVAILNHNKAEFYAISAKAYALQIARQKELEALVEKLIEEIEDAEDRETILSRANQKMIPMTLEKLRGL